MLCSHGLVWGSCPLQLVCLSCGIESHGLQRIDPWHTLPNVLSAAPESAGAHRIAASLPCFSRWTILPHPLNLPVCLFRNLGAALRPRRGRAVRAQPRPRRRRAGRRAVRAQCRLRRPRRRRPLRARRRRRRRRPRRRPRRARRALAAAGRRRLQDRRPAVQRGQHGLGRVDQRQGQAAPGRQVQGRLPLHVQARAQVLEQEPDGLPAGVQVQVSRGGWGREARGRGNEREQNAVVLG